MHFPAHVALIPDGNRTRATQHNQSVSDAYIQSYQQGVELVRYIFTNTPINVFTLRWLSTENAHKRPPEEFDFLMNMYKLVDEELDTILLENHVSFQRVGNREGMSADFIAYLDAKVERTRCSSSKTFVFALNYGWRDEIIRWVHTYLQTHTIDTLTEQTLSTAMDFGSLAPIELVIRTKGDTAQRTSWFMSWRIGYAELYFTTKKCPEFGPDDLQEALTWFDTKALYRNFGA